MGIVASAAGVRARQGEETRRQILAAAVNIASTHGLEGLSIGELAKELGMSKSGLFAHFGSKEELQLGTIGAAKDVFIDLVMRPAKTVERGMPRLKALMANWIEYLERRTFPGGCFFHAAAVEFDSRPGRVRDRIAELNHAWLEVLADEVRHAQRLGQFGPADAGQLAFELHAMVLEANWACQLFHDRRAFERARRAVERRLVELATAAGKARSRRR